MPLEPVDDGYGYSIDPKILAALSPEQLRYVIWEVTPNFFKPEDQRTLGSIGDILGVTQQTLYQWRRSPAVLQAFAAFGMYVVKSGIADRQVFENLVELTRTDVKAQEIYWKLRGALSDHAPPVELHSLNIDARQIRLDANDALTRFYERLSPAETSNQQPQLEVSKAETSDSPQMETSVVETPVTETPMAETTT